MSWSNASLTPGAKAVAAGGVKLYGALSQVLPKKDLEVIFRDVVSLFNSRFCDAAEHRDLRQKAVGVGERRGRGRGGRGVRNTTDILASVPRHCVGHLAL